MQVLKKFGVFVLFFLFAGMNTYAKTTKNSSKRNTKKATTHSLSKKNPSSKKPGKDMAGNKYPQSANTGSLNKVSQARILAIEAENLVSQTTLADKKEITPETTITVNKDLYYTRTVTKTIIPKKEEPSFSNTVMDWVKDKYSCMIDVLPNQISNVMLYRFIDDWYGVKYRMGGETKKGVDCSAFVQTLYKYVFGMDLLRTAYMQFNSSELITNPADLKEGDLVFFKVKSSRISHVGVYLSNNFFVHSASSKGVSIANLSSAYWSKYFAGGGRILSKS